MASPPNFCSITSNPNHPAFNPWVNHEPPTVRFRLRLVDGKLQPHAGFAEELARYSPKKKTSRFRQVAAVRKRLRYDPEIWENEEDWREMLEGSSGLWWRRTLLLCRAKMKGPLRRPGKPFCFALPDGLVISSDLLWHGGKGLNPLTWIPDWITAVGLLQCRWSELKNEGKRAEALMRWLPPNGASEGLLQLNGHDGSIGWKSVEDFRYKSAFKGLFEAKKAPKAAKPDGKSKPRRPAQRKAA